MNEDLLDPRLTEQRNPNTARIDVADSLEIVDLINAEDRRVPEAVAAERESIATAIDIAVECFRRGGRLIYVGAGTSGRLGVLDAAECPPTFGTDPDRVQGVIAGGYMALVRSQEGSEDRAESAATAMDERHVGPDDFVFGIAASSTTPFVRAALERANELGARTGFLCCTEPDPEVRDRVDVCIVPLVGPEVIAGSTRMKAGTATKLVLNTLTTGAMIRLGKVYQNLMVDLQANSEKLKDRGERIVMALSDVDRETARDAIRAADGSVKHALIMTRADVGPELSELMLEEAGGFVRTALQSEEAGGPDDPYARYPERPPVPRAAELTFDLLRTLPGRVRDLVSSVPEDRLSTRPAPEAWCVKEQIEHLITVDELMLSRIRAILTREDPELPNWDEEIENRRILESGARESGIGLLCQRLADVRTALLARVQAEGPEALDRTGRHELAGSVTVYQLLRHLVRHDDHHLRSIAALLRT